MVYYNCTSMGVFYLFAISSYTSEFLFKVLMIFKFYLVKWILENNKDHWD